MSFIETYDSEIYYSTIGNLLFPKETEIGFNQPIIDYQFYVYDIF